MTDWYDERKVEKHNFYFIFFRNKKVKFTKLIGYCDYRASNGYNDTLAFNRANFVNGIIDKVTNQKHTAIESKGKNLASRTLYEQAKALTLL